MYANSALELLPDREETKLLFIFHHLYLDRAIFSFLDGRFCCNFLAVLGIAFATALYFVVQV